MPFGALSQNSQDLEPTSLFVYSYLRAFRWSINVNTLLTMHCWNTHTARSALHYIFQKRMFRLWTSPWGKFEDWWGVKHSERYPYVLIPVRAAHLRGLALLAAKNNCHWWQVINNNNLKITDVHKCSEAQGTGNRVIHLRALVHLWVYQHRDRIQSIHRCSYMAEQGIGTQD